MVKDRINGKALRSLPGFKISKTRPGEIIQKGLQNIFWCIECYSDLTRLALSLNPPASYRKLVRA